MKFQDRYSQLNRLLHRLDFSTIEVQKALADIKDWFYAKCFSGIKIDRPVIITALPRAGTTLLRIAVSLRAARKLPLLLFVIAVGLAGFTAGAYVVKFQVSPLA